MATELILNYHLNGDEHDAQVARERLSHFIQVDNSVPFWDTLWLDVASAKAGNELVVV